MGNTEMTKYMAAGAFADLTPSRSKFDNSSKWLAGLAKSGRYQGKTYGVPYYAGSRVITYRTDLFSDPKEQAAIQSIYQQPMDFAFNHLIANGGGAVYSGQLGKLPDDTWVLRPQEEEVCFQPDRDTWHVPRVCGTFKERTGHPCRNGN